MLALGIRYLNGFVAASEPDVRERPEWPPHPLRVFMALAAAHFETGADPRERAALEWLESLPPPRLHAAPCTPRPAVTHYVPVNDKPGDRSNPPTALIQSIPQLARDRQPRSFARAWLDHEVAYLIWLDAAPDPPVARALEGLTSKVTRIGHSTSLVQMWLAGAHEVTDANWVADRERAQIFLRIAGPGTMDYLERCYNRAEIERWSQLKLTEHDAVDEKAQRAARQRLKKDYPQGPPVRRRPELRLYEGYAGPRSADGQPAARGTVFSPHLVVRTIERESGPFQQLDLLCAPQVIQRWREAILTQASSSSDSVRQLLSGHDRNGAPLEGPHLAFLPLAFVGHPHADGHLLGMGLVLPAGVDPEDRRQALRAIARIDRLVLGRLGTWRLGGTGAVEPPWNLRSEVWTAPADGATHWSTVTPIAFDRHPKNADRASYQREVGRMIAQACVRVGLPEPRDVVVTAVSAHLGVPPAHAFPKLQRKDGSPRRHAHAILVFDQPVRGPILLGAGRYRGYGACRPLDPKDGGA